MARHSSNRERIERMALEAEITRKEKAAGAASKPAPAKRATRSGARDRADAIRPAGRTKVVWLVCDRTGATVETYPYREESAARADAARRAEESGRMHFVKPGEVPFS